MNNYTSKHRKVVEGVAVTGGILMIGGLAFSLLFVIGMTVWSAQFVSLVPSWL